MPHGSAANCSWRSGRIPDRFIAFLAFFVFIAHLVPTEFALAQTGPPRFGRSYGMFGERVLGEPIRPPQPRFSQGIERTPDGIFQGIRPPGSGGYPRSEAARQAREFRYREWLTPEGNWSTFTPGAAEVAVPNAWVSPPTAWQERAVPSAPSEGVAPAPAESPVTPGPEAPGESGPAPVIQEAESMGGTPPAGAAGPTESAAGGREMTPELPPPSRWVNSTRAPRANEKSFVQPPGRVSRLLSQVGWREEIQQFKRDIERGRVLGGQAWESILSERVTRALGAKSVGGVRVRVEGGRAILDGRVTSSEAAQLAGRIVLLEPGIWEVVNRLEVTPP
ncbi:MAG: BON domain-containing protein [Thermoguttaceae bacterium]|nr:BON domain-containing protein [Thermoguttaceae bacterium]MDW8077641.1 BON domain-containing protein [Thermoguttaceae bacterium]